VEDKEMFGRLGAIAILLTAATLCACAVVAPQPTSTGRPLRYAGPVKQLVLPVSDLPAGTRITTEGPLTAAELDAALSVGDPGAFEGLLDKHGFIAAYYRTFGIQRSGGEAAQVECIVLLFPNNDGPKELIPARGDAMVAYGFRPISTRQVIGDTSRAVSVDGIVKDASGRDITVTSVRILYAYANVAVQVSIQEDPRTVDPLDAVTLANRELEFLKFAAPLAPPQ
jgi:hypothetical protein